MMGETVFDMAHSAHSLVSDHEGSVCTERLHAVEEGVCTERFHGSVEGGVCTKWFHGSVEGGVCTKWFHGSIEGGVCTEQLHGVEGGICTEWLLDVAVLMLLVFMLVKFRGRDTDNDKYILEVDPEDDIRENVINYDEEGAGEPLSYLPWQNRCHFFLQSGRNWMIHGLPFPSKMWTSVLVVWRSHSARCKVSYIKVRCCVDRCKVS